MLDQKKNEEAETILEQAYRLKEGKYCSRLLNDYADLAKALGNTGEEKAYRFRSAMISKVSRKIIEQENLKISCYGGWRL